ncbi:nucleotidyl transferase AbiEii/AbiGii toxin family protein [Slackia heliotrinireducens]|uniref:nucleotidyl transferase AbiEii/AbiGii toxin family protein n=1 Tax=Slackia heliotrinireducens TaxID=84110 RepID=UPI003315B6A8
MEYSSPKALEMAVKDAAKASPLDTNRAIAGFYFHRLLYRVFSEPGTPFVLKGGQGMLARTADARATRDIDLATDRLGVDAAVDELKRLAAKDAGDFVAFEFRSVAPIRGEDEYRDGYTVAFDAFIGPKRVQRVSVDLVADSIAIGEPDYMAPADRIDVRGIPVCDYPVYPSARAVADKVCGIVERHGGRPSSRVKDLMDIAVYALTEDFDAETLGAALKREASARRLSLGSEFALPKEWGDAHEAQYSKLAAWARMPRDISTISGALSISKALLDPVLSSSAVGLWSHVACAWVEDIVQDALI